MKFDRNDVENNYSGNLVASRDKGRIVLDLEIFVFRPVFPTHLPRLIVKI